MGPPKNRGNVVMFLVGWKGSPRRLVCVQLSHGINIVGCALQESSGRFNLTQRKCSENGKGPAQHEQDVLGTTEHQPRWEDKSWMRTVKETTKSYEIKVQLVVVSYARSTEQARPDCQKQADNAPPSNLF